MPLADQISHYASVVSWKVKQQGQIIHLQGQINDLEGQIGIQKSVLAEQAYKMYLEGAIVQEPLLPVCVKIKDLYSQKAEIQQELEIIRAQTPPAQETEPSQPSTPAETAETVAEAPAEWVEPDVPAEAPASTEVVIDMEPRVEPEPVAPAESTEWVDPGIPTEPPAPTESTDQQ
ncbi:MAG: hypothetical protein WA110_00070 [Anaerolineaceae bacterium]